MAEDDKLTPAALPDVAETLAFALRYSGRKSTHQADEMALHIAAERLMGHLALSGFVVSLSPM